MKSMIGLFLAFSIGFACRLAGVPLPAPPALIGALLVLAMTLGYVVMDRTMPRQPAESRSNCGGPSGRVEGGSP